MANDVSGANIRLGATGDGVVAELQRLRAQFALFSKEVSTKTQQAFRASNDAAAEYRKGLGQLSDKLASLSKQMLLFVALPSIFLGQQAYKDYANVQRLERGLAQYGETLEKVRRLAKEPNIGVFDGAKALIGLRAARIEANLAERAVRSFANAITLGGGNAADLEPALFNLKQFKATEHINQVDLRQLANRVPQTMEALERAFGTTDTAKLNSLGIDKFIEGFVAELEKLPKVAGGAAVAMEQLSDSATFFSAAIGEGLDKTFDISGKISALGGFLDNLTTNFKSLNPEGQKSVIWLAALPTITALVITGLAGLARAWLFLAAAAKVGFTAMTPPQFLAVAAVVVGLAASISGLIAVVKLLTNETAEYKRQQEEVNNLAPKVEPLIKKYDALKAITKPNLEQQKELKTVVFQIAELVPTAATAWDKYGRAVDINKDKVRGFVKELQNALKLMEPVRRQTLASELDASKTRADELRRQLREQTKFAELNVGPGVTTRVPVKMSYQELLKAGQELQQIEGRRVELQKELLSLGPKGVQQKKVELEQLVATRNALAEQLRILSRGYKTTNELAEINRLKNRIHDLDDEIKDATKSTTSLINAYNEAAQNSRDGIVAPRATNKEEDKRLAAMSVAELSTRIDELTEKYKALSPEEAGYLEKKKELITQLSEAQKRYNALNGPLEDITKKSRALVKEWIPMTELQREMEDIKLQEKIDKEIEAVRRAREEWGKYHGTLKGVKLEQQDMAGNGEFGGVLAGVRPRSTAFMDFEGIDPNGYSGLLASAGVSGVGGAELSVAAMVRRYQQQNAPAESKKRLAENPKDLANIAKSGTKNYLEEIKQQNANFDPEMSDAFQNIKRKEGESVTDYKIRVKEMLQARKQANAQITASIKSSGVEAGAAFGELLGDLINGENAFQNFKTKILTIIGQLLKDIGKSLIALGLAGKAFDVFKQNPALAIAAGIALTAIGSVVANNAQKKVSTARFAKGGMAYREMPAIIGDNPNARYDPEIVAPYSKVHNSLRQSIKEFSGSMGSNSGPMVITHRISGSDMLILVERAQKNRKGLRAQSVY